MSLAQFAYKDIFIAMRYMTDFTLNSCQHNFINVSWASICPPPPTSKTKLKPTSLLSSHPLTTITTHSRVGKITHCFCLNLRQPMLLPTKAVYKQARNHKLKKPFSFPEDHVSLSRWPFQLSGMIHQWLAAQTFIHVLNSVKTLQNQTARSSYRCHFNDVPMTTVAGKTNVLVLH